MLGEALRLIRVYHDLKQKEAAERLGVSTSYISEIERGTKTPTLDVIDRYSREFDIPVSSIMFRQISVIHRFSLNLPAELLPTQ